MLNDKSKVFSDDLVAAVFSNTLFLGLEGANNPSLCDFEHHFVTHASSGVL